MKRIECILLIGLAMLLQACRVPSYLPDRDKVGQSPYGAYISTSGPFGGGVRGELLAIDSDKLYVLTDSCVVDIPIRTLEKFTLKYAQPRRYGWSIPLLSLIAGGSGAMALFTLPPTLIVTIIVTNAGYVNFTYSEEDVAFDDLMMYARFPQGIPVGLDVHTLEPGYPSDYVP